MSKRQPLSTSEVETALADLPAWRIVNGKLHRDFKFKNFVQAFGFITQVAILAERLDHHPEWSNVYGQVSIDLVTHSAGNAISQLDMDLAHQIDEIIL
ncbi:MAG: 4a-hydroxytetrahydrobiopterin dehydratase [Caldilineaceae bacterium]